MKLNLKSIPLVCCLKDLSSLPKGKLLINTINAHSYNTATKDPLFAEALVEGGALIPDGVSIVMACGWLKAKSQPSERVTGWDLFQYEMHELNKRGGRCLFMGSSKSVLKKIRARAKSEFSNIEVVTYSPPYKSEFSDEDTRAIIEVVNEANPDLLWIGLTAPKQEKWVYTHWDKLNIDCHVGTIGAVFDFYAGTVKRAPIWWQKHSLEWLYRLIKEPRRMWHRYLVGNVLFLWNVAIERFEKSFD
ncbi:MAG: WecB/TagA/CpsF family glycosyltransferase [Rikenellaceae bacterium]